MAQQVKDLALSVAGELPKAGGTPKKKKKKRCKLQRVTVHPSSHGTGEFPVTMKRQH